jgi:hypothetical protein
MVRLVELCLNPKFMLAEFQRLPWLPSCGHPPHGGMMGTSGTGPPHPPPLTWVPVRGLLWLGLATQNRPFYLALKSSPKSLCFVLYHKPMWEGAPISGMHGWLETNHRSWPQAGRGFQDMS